MATSTAVQVVDQEHGEVEGAPLLSPQERKFVEEFFAGESAGNGTRSYMAVFADAAYGTASVESSELLKKPGIRAYLAELHRQATAHTAGKMLPWADLLPMAQSILIATAQGRIRNRLAFEAAIYLTNRVSGTPVASHEIKVRNHDRIATAVATFTKRMAEEQRRRILEVPHDE